MQCHQKQKAQKSLKVCWGIKMGALMKKGAREKKHKYINLVQDK